MYLRPPKDRSRPNETSYGPLARNTVMNISTDFQILLRIHEYNLRGEPVWFTNLAESLEGVIDRLTVSKTLDKADDCCLIEWEWIKVDGKWTRCVKIDRDFEGFIHGLYTASHEERDIQ